MLPAQPNKSLVDGLACLQHLASQEHAIAGSDLARELGLDVTRANRLLRTLAHLGLAEQNTRRQYRPGPGIHVLAAQAMFGSRLLRQATPCLEDLGKFNCIVALGVLWRAHVCYLYHANPDTPAGEALGRVGLYPAVESGIGCALLANEPDDQVRKCLAGHADEKTVAAMLPRLAACRETGVAIVPQGRSGRVISYGVAIGHRPTAAVGVSGQFTKDHEMKVIQALRDTADKIASNVAQTAK